MKIVGVLALKGGAGKTTTSIHIAGWAHMRGVETMLLDANADQGSASAWHSRMPADSPLVGLGCAALPRKVTLPGLMSLAAGAKLAVIDGMPYAGPEMEHAAACADAVVVPLRPGQFDLDACERTRQALDQADRVRASMRPRRPPMRRLLVLTQSQKGRPMEREALSLIEQAGWGELIGLLRFRTAFARAASAETVFQFASPRDPAVAEAQQVGAAVLAAVGLRGRR